MVVPLLSRLRRGTLVWCLLLLAILGTGLLSPYALNIPEGQGLVVISCFLFVWVILAALSNRAVFAGMLSLGLLQFIHFAGQTKLRLLNVPLRADDLTIFVAHLDDNIDVLWAYPKAVVLLSGLLCLLLLASWLAKRYERTLIPYSGLRPLAYRLLAALFFMGAGFSTWVSHYQELMIAFNRPILAGTQNYAKIAWIEGHENTCNVAQFIQSFAELGVWTPGRQGDPLLFLSKAAPLRRPKPPAPGRRPDIFIVLEESLFDLRILREYANTGIPMLDDTGEAKGVLSGTLRVHSYGGGTCLAELALLAGIYWGEFGPAGSYAPYVVTPHLRHSLAHQLKSLGYHTIAIYPVVSQFLGARQAYANYGFDEFYGSENLGMSQNWLEVTDDKVMRFAEERAAPHIKAGKPVFIFLLTIRNHGPHERTLPATKSTPQGDPFTNPQMRDYFDRIQDSSRDFLALQKRWLSADRERLLLFFGDHLPSLGGTMKNHTPVQRSFNRYGDETTWNRTPFSLRSNYPLAPTPPLPGDVDISYLGALLLLAGNVEPGPYFEELGLLGQLTNYTWVDAEDRDLVTSFLNHAVNDLGVLE